MIDPGPLAQYSFIDLAHFFVPKLAVATMCGFLVGLERELKSKVAGIKTNVLICVGSTLFTATSVLICGSHDLHVLAQIVAGVGFLGGGAIFKSESKVVGLTTATFIWLLAAMGMVVGCGGLGIAVTLTLGSLVTTTCLSRFEHKYVDSHKQAN